MNNSENYLEKWKAMMEEYDAKAERLEAEEKLRYGKWRENTGSQFDAMGDWTEATWDEFSAKAKQQWNDMVISSSSDDSSS